MVHIEKKSRLFQLEKSRSKQTAFKEWLHNIVQASLSATPFVC